MVFPKEVWFGFIPLVFCYTGSQPGFTTLYEDLMEINSPRLHEREKREVPTNTNDYEFQAVLGLSELEVLEVFLKNLSFPILINSTSQISSLDTTTVCSPNVTGYQCVCEENFAWSHNSCIAYGVCDVRLGDTCGCINDLPADGQFCQPNSSQIDATKCDLTPTPPTVTSSPPINYSAPDNKVTKPTLAKELQATENKETVITEIIQNKTLKSSTPGTPVMNATTSERDTTVGAVSRLLIVPSTTLNITTLGPSQNTNVSLISEKDPHTTMTNETTAKETVETTSTAVISEMSQSTEEKHEYSIRTTKATGLEDQGAATILGITLNTSISNAITPDQSQITTMTNAVTAEIAVETTSSASRPATRGNRETDAYSTGRTLNTELIDVNTRGTDLNTIVTNKTTAREAVETTSSAVISEISLSTEEKHEYSVRTTKTTGLEDATSPGLALNTTVTKVTTLGLGDQGAPTILGITLNTSVSSAITPDQSQITTMTNKTIAKEAVQAPSKAVILEMSLSTIRPENQNTTMANASSPEIILDTIVTNVTTTQIVVEITSNATKPKTTGHLTGTHETAPITLNTMVLNVVIAEQNKNTTMSNATSPDMILDTTNVTTTQMAVETTSSASRPATLGNTETDAYSTGRTLNMGLIDVNTQGTDLNTKVTNVTTAKEAVETTSRALISEISLSTEEKHKYSVRTTKTTGLKDTTSPRLALNTTVTNVTTAGLGDQGAPTILGKPLNTSVSNAITPDQSQITTMRNATSPEIILHMTNVNTTQIAVETTSSASRPATLGNTETDEYSTGRTLNMELIDANTRGTDLNTIVTNVTTAKITVEPTVVHEVAPETVVHATIQGITLNTTMSNATSPEIILDTTNVTATKTQEFNETFTINMDFNNSYNDPSSKVYKDVYGAAKSSCQKFVSETCEVQSLTFRSGSTIAYYTLAASSGDVSQVKLAKDEMLKHLAETYPIESVDIKCRDDAFVNGPIGFVAKSGCKEGNVGDITAVCQSDGKYGQIQDNCDLKVVKNLLNQSEVLDELTLPLFLERLSNVTVDFTNEITDSPANIDAIVRILSNVANLSSSLEIKIEQDSMKNILETAGTLTMGKAKRSWETLNNSTRNTDETKNASSALLYSIERITSRLVNKSFSIETPHICLNKSTFVNTFSGDLNSSVKIDIPNIGGHSHSITTIIFASLDNVLPARDKRNSSSKVINGKVALLWPEGEITNIVLAFDVLDDRLRNPECVFWDFDLFGGLGGWNDDGCSLGFNENGIISCHCNHTTSFCILMSPNSSDHFILTYITYSGIAVSIVSLIICLIIEGIIWKTIGDNMTSYLRHVSVVNIAVSLLIADIWFIIGAAISNTKSVPACTAATFFMHYFYLALFFWMLASALLLLYRTFNVFNIGLSKTAMLIIGFSLGYGAPLIIATITITVTAPSNHYIRETTVCFLSWDTHKTLLAFVIPALTIVAINIIILTLVISIMLRRRVGLIGAQARERHALLVIVRCLAVLTPIFGVNWVLGIGTMVYPRNFGLEVAFALLNSLQGFCILMFGTPLDKKVISELAKKFSCQIRTRTTSTASSFSMGKLFWMLRRPTVSQKGYHWSSEGSCD